ncbi:MAG: TerB family tellurite resistance protein [Bacteroidales bacterium]|jgi:DnaJ like chaperone protein
MAKLLKWIGGGLGWVAGGPIGALIGFAIGALFEGYNESKTQYKSRKGRFERPQTTKSGFYVTLLVLSASVMKADGRNLKSELDYIKAFLLRQFGETEAQRQLLILRQLLEKDYDLADVCRQIRFYMEYQSRLQLLHYLFGIAKADGVISAEELNTISRIANYMGVTTKDFESIKAMFIVDTNSDYEILEIKPDASDEDVKKAYRRMALKYHPDKVAHLGENVQKAANEKFLKLQKAYDNIKKERNMI